MRKSKRRKGKSNSGSGEEGKMAHKKIRLSKNLQSIRKIYKNDGQNKIK